MARVPVGGGGPSFSRGRTPAGDLPVGTNGQQLIVRSDGTVGYIDIPVIYARAWGVLASNSAALNATNLQAMIAALPAGGAKVLLTRGAVSYSSTLNFDGLRSITLDGEGGVTAGAAPTSQLIYTGTSGAGISARSTFGFTCSGVGLQYSSASYNGTLVDFSATGTKGSGTGRGADSAYMSIDSCYLGSLATGSRSANAELINLDHCISSRITNCVFEDANYGITGTSGSGSYSNVIHIGHCTFVNLITAAIHNPNTSWTINDSCTFEPLIGGAPGAVVLDSTALVNNLVFDGNWVGDSTVVGRCIDLQGTVVSATITNNTLNCGPTSSTGSCVRTGGTVRVLIIEGNIMSGSYGYDWNAGGVFNSIIRFNHMGGVTAGWSPAAASNASPGAGNVGFWGFNYGNAAAAFLDSWRTPSGNFAFYGNMTFGVGGSSLGFYGAAEVVRPVAAATTTGFTAGAGTAMNSASTSTGGSGASAYTFGDIVLALKQLGLITL